jgi:hypothetical protein
MEVVLKNPTNEEIADCLGFNESIDFEEPRDVIMLAAVRRDWRPRCTRRPKASTL